MNIYGMAQGNKYWAWQRYKSSINSTALCNLFSILVNCVPSWLQSRPEMDL